MILIFVDFNYSTKLLPLRFKGSFEDIRKKTSSYGKKCTSFYATISHISLILSWISSV